LFSSANSRYASIKGKTKQRLILALLNRSHNAFFLFEKHAPADLAPRLKSIFTHKCLIDQLNEGSGECDDSPECTIAVYCSFYEFMTKLTGM